ncbi:MAG: hypothetical protein R2707_16120 [Acidimicrobiales bacterium]
MMLGTRARITALSAAVGIAAAVNLAAPWDDGAPPTLIGTAGVALGDDTARIVERVNYRQDVERIGDVVIIDGRPRDELAGELAAVWEIVDGIWPQEQRAVLAQLSVVRESPRGLVGVVHPSATGGWILSLDVADLADRALIEETIVHELSHVVTLDREVFTFGEVDGCTGTAIELGCAAPGSVLAAFADRFWSGDTAGVDAADFVNDYASTSAHEDLAETFTAWVLDWPVDGVVIDAKMDMLAADPELSALADALRARLVARANDEPRP